LNYHETWQFVAEMALAAVAEVVALYDDRVMEAVHYFDCSVAMVVDCKAHY